MSTKTVDNLRQNLPPKEGLCEPLKALYIYGIITRDGRQKAAPTNQLSSGGCVGRTSILQNGQLREHLALEVHTSKRR